MTTRSVLTVPPWRQVIESINMPPRHSLSATPSVSDAGEPARLLPWDSDFFGHRIARVRATQLNAQSLEKLLSWCDSERIDCLYFLASAGDWQTLRIAEDNGFQFVDIRMTLECSLKDSAEQPDGIRVVKPGDILPMKRLASQSFSDTRFYNDPHFSKQKCDELYAVWLERSCQGFSDCVLIAEQQGQPAGFITCSLENSEGIIGLIAVDPNSQGCGLGGALVRVALRYFYDHGATCARVVTQGSNVKSQRLYQRCGFVTRSVELWYHRWFAHDNFQPDR